MSEYIYQASVRVVPDGSGTRPSRDRVLQVAKTLAQIGFEILRPGRFGISIVGDSDAFERAFHVRPHVGISTEVEPAAPELEGLVDHIEIPPEPIPFS